MTVANNPYDGFRKDPFISTIASTKKWTVSTKDKMPIDMYELKYRGRVKGALYNNDLSLTSLDDLHSVLPNAANFAFYLDVLADNFVVLDIEPICPDDIKQKLLQMPCLYCERSMSGKGIHMVFRLSNDQLAQYPAAMEKTALKEPHKYYEILMNHYVTFTGNMMPANISDDNSEFLKLFQSIASEQKVVEKTDVDIEQIEDVNTPHTQHILEALVGDMQRYQLRKTPENFYNDMSKYEFSCMGHLYASLRKMCALKAIKQIHTYTDSEQAWFLWKTASETFPYRPKHDETRNGMPWLLYLASAIIASNKNDKNSKEGDNGGQS